MITPWSDLPNAALIDRILAAVRARPEARSAAWSPASAPAWDAARDAAWAAARDAAWAAASDIVLTGLKDADWAYHAILALIAWDDCAHLLDTDPDQVQIMALLGHHPAVLLYPACLVLSKSSIKSMTSAA